MKHLARELQMRGALGERDNEVGGSIWSKGIPDEESIWCTWREVRPVKRARRSMGAAQEQRGVKATGIGTRCPVVPGVGGGHVTEAGLRGVALRRILLNAKAVRGLTETQGQTFYCRRRQDGILASLSDRKKGGVTVPHVI